MEQLGIQPIQLLMQTINFVIIVVLLTKFLYSPILKVLDERRKKIAEGLEYTEKMKKEMEKTEAKREAVLAKAKIEAKEIIEEAKQTAKQVEADIVARGREEVEELRERMKMEVKLEKENMLKEAQDQASNVALVIVEKVLQNVLNNDAQKRIIERKIASLKTTITKS